ncbi:MULTISPECIES: 3-oxoacyl-ACP reductase FabG [unclassified Pseudoalteromonas]|uniref:3-oxoacyl-ACP reductase FabG n=1 Tax=unclassified Pseudoalteromonas TaxID=194690 RepID=UPI0025B5B411|nr:MULTISPECIES: 3-oxoacyl-ACP reductase FabG [unclassified Pseudoalteromonas]MDN3377553.1 3-oxoacyl-ACP reductase FabG [Pseudoalteromonas sp. APC 3893]MDN3385280.1 3-oxoacyl-ACP reductase FabG [Pseudoalteromonas sp. APC 4017]
MSKRVLVTGSSKGIGKAVALQLAKDGFNISLHCRSGLEAAEQVKAEIAALGVDVDILQFDVADRASAKAILDKYVETHGAFYGVVCNAGITADTAFPAMTDEEWDSVVHTNLDGFYNVLHPLVMPMVRTRKGGRIVAMSSVSGVAGNRGQVNYSASKAGVIGASKALAVELAKRKITVNCVAPGLIDTGMTDDLPIAEMTKMIPANRMGNPEEVAAAVSFLMSDGASYITRQVLQVNGGMA